MLRDALDGHLPYGALAEVEERRSTLSITPLPDLPFEDIVTHLQAGPGAFWFVDLLVSDLTKTIKIGRCEFASWPSPGLPGLPLLGVPRRALVKYFRTLGPVELAEDDIAIPQDKGGLLDDHALPSLPFDDPLARCGDDDDDDGAEGSCVTVLVVLGSSSPDETALRQVAALTTIARQSFVHTHLFAALAGALPHAPRASVIMLMPRSRPPLPGPTAPSPRWSTTPEPKTIATAAN